MMRSIFILFVMLQWTSSCYGDENSSEPLNEREKFMDMSSFDDSDSSIEELTTVNSVTETNPPIITQTTSTVDETYSTIASSVMLAKLVAFESTESTEAVVEISTPAAIATKEVSRDESKFRKTTKSIKNARLLTPASEEIVMRVEHKDDETFEATRDEDTTPISELEAEINGTNVEMVEDETTIQPATSKKPKKIEIYKTRPNELLRHYVEDSHLRSPVAALIDKKSNPLLKAKKLWKAALRPNALLDIMVVSYDSEGIKSTYNLTNTRAMMSTLDRVREENSTSYESKTYYSIIRTGQLIPYDSAIFLSTDKLPNDTEHQQPASMILLKKRIRLYLIIFDEKNHVVKGNSSTVVRQTGFLGQLALRTGGDVIYVPNHAFRPDGEMGLITLVVGNRLKPIDSELKEVYENELKSENTETVSDNEETTSIH